MSRTYRKNSRWYDKIAGKYYCHYRDHSVKDKKGIIFSTNQDWGEFRRVFFSASSVYREVLVGDGDCISKLYITREDKRRCHKTDRSRLRCALSKDWDDPYYTPAFNAWDYD